MMRRKIHTRNDLKKLKHDLEIEVMSRTKELERIEDEQNNMNKGAEKIPWNGFDSAQATYLLK